jgi:adenine-specific DNA-methyltransferase
MKNFTPEHTIRYNTPISKPINGVRVIMPRDNYAEWDKQELIEHIRQLESRKKYGLVWDEERTKEQFEAEAENNLPVLVEDPDLAIETDPDQPTHILIEGDNYHALSVLNYTHENSVDLIYIDPPYNTGSNSWRYNNQFVETDDAFRHSKWLSFMSKRLNLAKRLLTKTGILAIAIDDYELSPLVLLLDDIFGEKNRLGIVVIENNPRGRTTNDFFATSHEYCLFYAKDSSLAKILDAPLTDEQAENFNLEDEKSPFRLLPFRRSGGLSTPDERPNSYYPLYYSTFAQK